MKLGAFKSRRESASSETPRFKLKALLSFFTVKSLKLGAVRSRVSLRRLTWVSRAEGTKALRPRCKDVEASNIRITGEIYPK